MWKNYVDLCGHFETSSKEKTKLKIEQAVFQGLWKRICFKQFFLDLTIMHDVLHELPLLSEGLQKRNVTILYTDSLIHRCIKHLEDMKQEKGKKVIETEQAIEKMIFISVKLTDCKKIKSIIHGQLLQILSIK